MYTVVFCAVCFAIGAVSILSGALNWDWWMHTLGRLAVVRYGRGNARLHFIVFGILILGLGAYHTWDAVGAAERLQPLHMYLVR